MTDTKLVGSLYRWFTIACRVIVGAVFVVSGCAKMIDPWGFTFKIDDYLAVWHWVIPHPLILAGSALLSLTEFCAGVAMMLGCCRRLSLYVITAIMAVMLPLTIYIAAFNPVPDCGCFGDWIVISNTATLIKNIALTVLIIWLWRSNRRVGGAIPIATQWISTTFSLIYIITIGIIGYNIQPLIDFRPYPIGTSLSTADSDDDESITFIYEKDGQQHEFTDDNLPDDTWTFVSRSSNTDTNDAGITIYDEADEQLTLNEIAGDDHLHALVVVPDLSAIDPSMTFAINELYDAVVNAGGSMSAIIQSRGENTIKHWRDFALSDYEIFTTDPVDIKILARGIVGIVMVDNGKIIWKRTLSSINTDKLKNADTRQLLVDHLTPPGKQMFSWMTAIFVILQLSLTLPLLLKRSISNPTHS